VLGDHCFKLAIRAHRSWQGLLIAPGVPLKHQGSSPSAPTGTAAQVGQAAAGATGP
jgi:hypothetical protein